MAESQERSVAIIGAGLFGLITAKVLLQDFGDSFDSVTVFEKNSGLGGVWSANSIYPGLTSNSPALTYEIPGYQFPENLRGYGSHVKAEDINSYLLAFARQYDLSSHIQFESLVQDVGWDEKARRWTVQGRTKTVPFQKSFKYLVICNGMYHDKNMPAKLAKWGGSNPTVYHSADVGDPSIRRRLAASKHTVVVGAGKSAIDLATMIASKAWGGEETETPQVTLLYQKPHWLSPRAMLRGTVYFERLLFSRFLNAWLPYANSPDLLHDWIANSQVGQWMTRMVFRFVSDDFKKSVNHMDLPETIPDHPMKASLSGALHVAPIGYIDLVRSGRIRIIEGSLSSIDVGHVQIATKTGEDLRLPVEHVLCATGYRLAFPFLSNQLLNQLGLSTELPSGRDGSLPHVKLYRLIAPPKTLHSDDTSQPHRNIAFNGFAYSLLNPTVGFVAAQWIGEYLLGRIAIPSSKQVEQEIENYYTWQKDTFGVHGAKGTHIGSHATLYSDTLLQDMQLETAYVHGTMLNPLNFFQQWFRPMFPQIYSGLSDDRKMRDAKQVGIRGARDRAHQVRSYASARLTAALAVILIVPLSWITLVKLVFGLQQV